jgi:hypothetical protein
MNEAKERAEAYATLERLLEKWPEPRICPICSTPDRWSIGAIGGVPRNPPAPEPLDVSRVSPVFPVSCQVCGYTMFFDPITLGTRTGGPGVEETSPETEPEDEIKTGAATETIPAGSRESGDS